MMTDDQMTMFDLPALPPPTIGEPAERPKRNPVRRAAAVPPPAAAPSPWAPVPDTIAGIMLVDPRMIVVDPVNVRRDLPFDPAEHAELIDSMRGAGNTVPVRLRRDPAGGAMLLCPSGSRRLGAALHIQRERPDFRLRAIIAETMDDRAAFALGEADNAGRTGVAPMRQARSWAATLATVYGGDRGAFIAATGRSASVVSRTLALAALPEHILAACSDVEALTPWFAEQLAPRLADPASEPDIRRRAEAIVTAGRPLPGPKLVRALLEDDTAPPGAPQTLWRSQDGTRHMRFRPAANGGGRIDVPALVGVAAVDRRSLVKAFEALLKTLPISRTDSL